MLVSPDWIQAIQSSDRNREILEASWERCRKLGLDPAGGGRLRRVDAEELQRRKEENRAWVELASPNLAWVSASFTHVEHVLHLADRDGIVLWAAGNLPSMEPAGLAPGFDWSEPALGTNGPGTALRSGAPVSVIGSEHFCAAHHSIGCVSTPVHDPEGTILGAITFATRAPEADPEWLLLAAYVAHVIEEELEYQTEILRHETALAIAAHELKNPVSSLLLLLQGLGKGLKKNLQDTSSMVDEACRDARNLSTLVALLLDLSGMQVGRVLLRPTGVDLVKLIQRALTRAREGGVITSEITIEAPSQLRGRWDPIRLEQVFRNLLSNALKYGEGKPVHVSLWREGDSVRLVIRDQGIGIEPEAQKRIFQPFQRATTVERAGSLGLGLYVSRRIVEAHGGRITVESEPGKGSCFLVELPVEVPEDLRDT